MAWYTGNCATNGAGELITLLDTELVKNANWTIHDAAAGTNAKVYKNTNALKDFYLYVDDNQADCAFVKLYESWDEVSHVGSGYSLTNSSQCIYKYLSYGIHVDDDCFYLVFIDGKKTVFIGAIDSRDASKRIVCMIVGKGPGYASQNPVGLSFNTNMFAAALYDENGVTNNISGIGSLQKKDINGAANLQEIVVLNASTGKVMGTLPGLTMGSSSTDAAAFADGDVTTISGLEWAFCMYQNGTTNYGANWYRKS